MDTNFKFTRARLMTSAATGLAMFLAGTNFAYAQEADEADAVVAVPADSAAEKTEGDKDAVLDTVVVSGFRQSIANSIATKRTNTSIVEAISAEDIGKLPDNSIAESLARLPGLTAQRLRGRAQVISVRGLGPDFTTALLNGREQVTAGDNRGVEFDQYPSELLSQVLVYKSPDAALMGQGLAGTADLRTVRPLDHGERTVSVSARYEYADIGALNPGSDDTGYRVTGTYIDQFAHDTLGIMLAFADQSSPTQAERWDSWGYPTTGANNDLLLGGAKPYVESRNLERTAFAGTLQYEPTPAFRTSIDVLQSNFKDAGNLRGIEIPLAWSGSSLRPGYETSDGFVTAGIFDNVQGVVRNDYRGRDADVLSAGWNVQYDFNDKWTVEGDLSLSRVKRDDVDLEIYAGTGSGFGNGVSDTLAFMRTGDGSFVFGSQLDYTDTTLFGLTDPQGWGQIGYIKRPKTDDELHALRLSLTRNFDSNFISSVEFGANYTEREKTKASQEAFVRLANPGTDNFQLIPAEYLLANTSLDFIGIPGQLSFDPFRLLNSGLLVQDSNGNNPDVLLKAWQVNEDVLTLYAMANIDTAVDGIPVRGNVGVQYVETDQSSSGPANNAVGVTISDGVKYSEVLPSMNLSMEIADKTFVRFAAARTLARARLDQIAASGGLPGVDTTVALRLLASGGSVDPSDSRSIVLNGSGGNPRLRPYIANGIDLSFEKYFGSSSGYVSAAAFWKGFDTFVDPSSSAIIDYSSILSSLTLPPGAESIPNIQLGSVSGPANFHNGSLRGLEFAASIPADMFVDGPLGGFGVFSSISFTESEVTPDDQTTPQAIEGLSETVGNVTLYYEWAGFEARVSNRFRSDFLGEVTGFGAGRELRNIKGDSVVDAQIGYTFHDGALDGLAVQLQANNLTDEEFVTYLNDDPRQVKDYQRYGTTYLLGVSYKF
ncbi:MAG: TonB-dependent receptor [Hyphomonas sp.]|nr:TonB-dependent receptor [Hyphomonas sp.]MCB9971741.1 TonB-dependent receptor [Hyphomonas sp.]